MWTSVRSSALPAHAKPISSLQFSHDGAFVASASADRSVKVWTTAALLERDNSPAAPSTHVTKPRASLFGHEEGVNDVSWSHDGCYLVSASDDTTARIWDVEYSKSLSTLGRAHNALHAFHTHDSIALETTTTASDGHANVVFSAQFNPQGSLIATASVDESVKFWDVRTGRVVASLEAHHEPIVSARFNGDGTLLVTASYDGLARIWDVATRACLRTIVGSEPRVPLTHAQFTPNSRFVLLGTLASALSLVDYVCDRRVQSFRGHVATRYCSNAAFGVGERGEGRVVSGSEDGRVCVWDVASGRLVQELVVVHGAKEKATAAAPVIAVDHHPLDAMLVASADAAISVWTATQPTGDSSRTDSAAAVVVEEATTAAAAVL